MARTNMLPINANLYRHKGTDSDKDCLICKGQVENERHVIYVCPMYTSLKKNSWDNWQNCPFKFY